MVQAIRCFFIKMSQNGVFMRCVSACKCAFGDLLALFKSPYYSDFK